MAVALAFADPVRDAQAAFRAVMNAMARPGSVQPVARLAGAPAPLSPTAAAIAVALPTMRRRSGSIRPSPRHRMSAPG